MEVSARRERDDERDRRRPHENAVPRANPPVDDYDVERGRDKLERVIGK
ncbi:MAG: hypothetical protein QOK04_2077 [Solirubrobacteraceae bacterium]|nr:hypothetical protein [Solirubrobacteraceae bacterium]